MRSISDEIIKEWEDHPEPKPKYREVYGHVKMEISSFNFSLIMRAKQHTETCKLILDEIRPFNPYKQWLKSEIEKLEKAGLI